MQIGKFDDLGDLKFGGARETGIKPPSSTWFWMRQGFLADNGDVEVWHQSLWRSEAFVCNPKLAPTLQSLATGFAALANVIF